MSPNTAGGDCSEYLPSFSSPSTPFFRSTRPSLPNPAAAVRVVIPGATRYGPSPVKPRASNPADPGQYASPRNATGSASYFHSRSPVSGTSAYTPSGAVTYITPLTTIGTASDPGFPVRNVQAALRRPTFDASTCRKGE